MAKSWIGETIGGRYEIDSLLGQGGMSAVYRANDPNLRRMVAIKFIHPHLSSNPNFVHRFKEEAAAVARLRHPNIVQVHDFNSDGETYFMVMEYLTGESLQAHLRRLNKSNRLMAYTKVIKICAQMCDALGYAHKHDLVHRDVKPANIMLAIHDQAVLMDFGIVKIIGGEHHTATGATLGTVKYMSPEQMRSDSVDETSDIYSLGVTLFEMISGRVPFIADSVPSLMMIALNDPLPDLRTIRKGVPEELVRVVEKALAREKEDRYQTMEQMAAALEIAGDAVQGIQLEETVLDADVPGEQPSSVMKVDVSKGAESSILPGAQLSVKPERIQQPEKPDQTPPERSTVFDVLAERSSSQHLEDLSAVSNFIRRYIRRILLAGAGFLVVAGAVIASMVYQQTQEAPAFEITSLTPSSGSLSAQTAEYMVSLGIWETGSQIAALEFSPDGSLIGTVHNLESKRFSPYRYYGVLWDVEAEALRYYLLGHTQWVYSAAFSPDGQLFATASDDDQIILWNVNDGSQVRSFESSMGGIIAIDFSINNLLLASGSWDGEIALWQLNGQLLRTLEGNEISGRDIEFSPDGKLIASAYEDGSIKVWQVTDGRLVHTLEGHSGPIRSVEFSPNGLLLASASEDTTIGIWQVSDGALIRNLEGNSAIVLDIGFSTDGSLLVSGADDGKILLWQISDGNLLRELEKCTDSVTSIAFSPRGDLLVAGTWDGAIKFWGMTEAIELDPETPQSDP